MPSHACPCILFAVIGPVVDFTDILLPCLALFTVIRVVLDDGFDFILLQVVIILFTTIARIGDDDARELS
ncbi:hypothetical protein D1872_233330 [compost metagenome]